MILRLDSGFKLFGAAMIFITACLAALPFMSSRQANQTMEALKHVASDERSYNALLSVLRDAETGQRGFLLGGDESFLEPYNASVASIPATLSKLATHAESRREQELIGTLSRLSREKIAGMQETIALKRAGRLQEAVEQVTSGREKIVMDELRALLTGQVEVLAGERNKLRDEITFSLRYNAALGVGASLLSLVVICLAIWIAYNSLHERAQAAAQAQELAHTNARFAQHNEERANRLALTATMLQALDSIRSPADLGEVLPVFLRKLLPASTGAIFLYNHSRDRLERIVGWGQAGHHETEIAAGDCWGLRLGKLHHSAAADDLRCAHGNVHADAESQLCLPMISQGDVIGLMMVGTGDTALLAEREAIVALAEQVGLAVSNVLLRDTLRQQSIIDPLTGLYNRRYFDESLRRELLRAARMRTACALVMIDLDHFKRVNDTYGHDGGDLVLKTAAQHLRDIVRGGDVACRYGGEELVLLLPDCDAAAAARCAEKLRDALGTISISHAGQTITGITASFGVAAVPEHGDDGEELLKQADRALYAAKKAGRDRVLIAQHEHARVGA